MDTKTIYELIATEKLTQKQLLGLETAEKEFNTTEELIDYYRDLAISKDREYNNSSITTFLNTLEDVHSTTMKLDNKIAGYNTTLCTIEQDIDDDITVLAEAARLIEITKQIEELKTGLDNLQAQLNMDYNFTKN